MPPAPDLKGRFWLCPQCGKHVPTRLAACRCGFSRAGVDDVAFETAGGGRAEGAAAGGTGGQTAAGRTGTAWFAVGPTKLVVMGIGTLGLYQLYWFYQQWRRVRDSGEDVWPLPRSVFGVLYCYPLFKRILESTADVATPVAGPGGLAVAYILLSISWKLPSPLDLIAILSVLPLAAAQAAASAGAARDFPRDDPNRRLTAANWIGVTVGAALIGLVVYGTVVRDKPTSPEFLARVAAEINRKREPPSGGVDLVRVEPGPRMLVYYYSVSEEARPRVEERRPRLKELIRPSLCRDRLLKAGVTVRFVYTDLAGSELARADVAPWDCR